MYTINFTDKTKLPIMIDESEVDNSTDITMFGRKRLAYGEELQDNLIHILENFACPEDSNNPGNPDQSRATDSLFQDKIEGQWWFNSTKKLLNYYDGTKWIPIAREDDIASNWGIIADGQFLPKPVSESTGRTFDYSECVWIVSPFNIPQKIDYLECQTDNSGLVSMKMRYVGVSNIVSGLANYMIVGIGGNVNQPQATVQITPTPTPTPTSSVGQSATPTPTVTRSATPVPTLTPTPTPQASISATPATSLTPSPTISPSPTPTPSNTPSASAAPLVIGIPSSSFTSSCNGLSTDQCTPSRSSTLTAVGGVGPYTYGYDLISGDSLNTFGSFNTPTPGALSVSWIGPKATIGTDDNGTGTPRYTTIFRYKVTDARCSLY
jgi:hypothetical protein